MVAIISHNSHRNHRMAKIRKDLLVHLLQPLLKQGYPQQGAQEYLVVFGGLRGGDSSFSPGSLCQHCQ